MQINPIEALQQARAITTQAHARLVQISTLKSQIDDRRASIKQTNKEIKAREIMIPVVGGNADERKKNLAIAIADDEIICGLQNDLIKEEVEIRVLEGQIEELKDASKIDLKEIELTSAIIFAAGMAPDPVAILEEERRLPVSEPPAPTPPKPIAPPAPRKKALM